MPSIGIGEWIFIFLIVLVIFGPSSLPKIGRGLGKGIREFKDAISGIGSAIEQEETERLRSKAAQSREGVPTTTSAVSTNSPTAQDKEDA